MSPLVADTGRRPEMSNVLNINVGTTSFNFELDPRLGPRDVAPETQELSEQVLDESFQRARETLLGELRQSRLAVSAHSLLARAANQEIFNRCHLAFEALDHLGYHPFKSPQTPDVVRNFPRFDAEMRPIANASVTDSFGNISRQALASAIFLDRLLKLAASKGVDLTPGFAPDDVVSMSVLSKALKPWEIIDRIALKDGQLDKSVRPDAHSRLHAHMQRLVEAGLISPEQGEQMYFVAQHTVGREGMLAFLRRGSGQNFSVVGNPAIQLVRACDDIRVYLAGDAAKGLPELFVPTSPADKIIAISGRRGAGLLGDTLSYEDESATAIRMTPAQAQEAISTCILADVAKRLDLVDASGPVWAVIRAVESYRPGMA